MIPYPIHTCGLIRVLTGHFQGPSYRQVFLFPAPLKSPPPPSSSPPSHLFQRGIILLSLFFFYVLFTLRSRDECSLFPPSTRTIGAISNLKADPKFPYNTVFIPLLFFLSPEQELSGKRKRRKKRSVYSGSEQGVGIPHQDSLIPTGGGQPAAGAKQAPVDSGSELGMAVHETELGADRDSIGR